MSSFLVSFYRLQAFDKQQITNKMGWVGGGTVCSLARHLLENVFKKYLLAGCICMCYFRPHFSSINGTDSLSTKLLTSYLLTSKTPHSSSGTIFVHASTLAAPPLPFIYVHAAH